LPLSIETFFSAGHFTRTKQNSERSMDWWMPWQLINSRRDLF